MAVGVEARIAALDWSRLEDSLDALGHARAPGLLSAPECAELVDLWQEPRFRAHVDMARHRFGVNLAVGNDGGSQST